MDECHGSKLQPGVQCATAKQPSRLMWPVWFRWMSRASPFVQTKVVSKSITSLRLLLLALVVSAGLVPSAFATVNYVQSNVGLDTSPQSMAITYTAAQTAGDLNIVFIAWADSSVHVQSVTDTKGNTYSVAAGPTISSTGNAALVSSIGVLLRQEHCRRHRECQHNNSHVRCGC